MRLLIEFSKAACLQQKYTRTSNIMTADQSKLITNHKI